MDTLTFIDLAIGASLIYLVLSLIASEIQELLTSLFEWRAKHLKESISAILSSDLIEKLYQNPLLKSLNHKSSAQKSSLGPSYISAERFANVLLLVLQDEYKIEFNPSVTLEEMVDGIEKSHLPPNVKENILLLARKAQYDLSQDLSQFQQLRREIEQWYDLSMERASGVYKRNAKLVALILGLAISVIVNVDAIYTLDSLAQAPALRSTLTQFSEEIVANNPNTLTCLEAADDRTEKSQCLDSVQDSISVVFNDISGLPIGWDWSKPFEKQFSPFTLQALVKTIVGWLLSALAISMGAPFWFELLNKIINVRNTGKKPPSSAS